MQPPRMCCLPKTSKLQKILSAGHQWPFQHSILKPAQLRASGLPHWRPSNRVTKGKKEETVRASLPDWIWSQIWWGHRSSLLWSAGRGARGRHYCRLIRGIERGEQLSREVLKRGQLEKVWKGSGEAAGALGWAGRWASEAPDAGADGGKGTID